MPPKLLQFMPSVTGNAERCRVPCPGTVVSKCGTGTRRVDAWDDAWHVNWGVVPMAAGTWKGGA
uniref:Uncharacterized protein n=1 Tax=Arundo donax TaxID=35708 RepID=A0A0A9AQY7_ARUDO